MSNIQQAFSTASGIADQALFLTDLIAFFEMKPTIESKPNALPAPRPILRGFEFRNVSFRLSRHDSAGCSSNFNFTLQPGERMALIGENGQGKTTVVKLITRLYDPTEGADPARWRRSARIRSGRPALRDRRHLSGLHAL